MAKRTREQNQAIYARRRERAQKQTGGKGYGYLRRLDDETRARLRDAHAQTDEAYARSLVGKWKPPPRVIEQPTIIQFDGGEYREAEQATAIRRTFDDLGDRQVAFRVSFEGEERFISMIRNDIATDLQPGAGRGSSGRHDQPVDGPVRFYPDDGAGLQASDVVRLIRYFGSTLDALYSLWLRVSP